MTSKHPFLAILALLLLAVPAIAEEAKETLGKAPDFQLEIYGGGEFTLSEALKDGPILIDFWATWCGPCRKAMPHYQSLLDKFAEHGLQVFAISQDNARGQSKIGAYFRKQELTFPSLLDADKQVGRKFGVRTLPVSFLIAQDGQIVARHIGFFDGDEKILADEIRELLDIEEPH